MTNFSKREERSKSYIEIMEKLKLCLDYKVHIIKLMNLKVFFVLSYILLIIVSANAQDTIKLKTQSIFNFHEVNQEFYVVICDSLNLTDTLYNSPETSYRGLIYDGFNRKLYSVSKIEAWWNVHSVFLVEEFDVDYNNSEIAPETLRPFFELLDL